MAWAASPQRAVPGTPAMSGLRRQTMREIVFTSAGGSAVRVRFTNAFGGRPLEIGDASIAIAGAGANLRSEPVPLTFAGKRSVAIAPGAETLSDPAALDVAPLQALAVSVFVAGDGGRATEHADAQQVNYVAAGDHVDDLSTAPFATRSRAWEFLDGVEVPAQRQELGTVIPMGDSITDGVGSLPGKDARWPNDLARRLDAFDGGRLSVIDEGIGGNRLLNSSPGYGEAGLLRFPRDVLMQPDAREVIVLEGLNDIGFSRSTSPLSAPHAPVSAARIIDGYRNLIARAHAAGLGVFGATLTPFSGARYWTPAGEAEREAINRWIVGSGAFDGVLDLASAIGAPGDPQELNPAYDSGDHLHPNDAGYQAMADAVDLAQLVSRADASATVATRAAATIAVWTVSHRIRQQEHPDRAWRARLGRIGERALTAVRRLPGLVKQDAARFWVVRREQTGHDCSTPDRAPAERDRAVSPPQSDRWK